MKDNNLVKLALVKDVQDSKFAELVKELVHQNA